ncbi:MAG: hypothetical protein Q9216_006490 [Gyalolechia sp. 2 TL-2023]
MFVMGSWSRDDKVDEIDRAWQGERQRPARAASAFSALRTRNLPSTVLPLRLSSSIRHFDELQTSPRRSESTVTNMKSHDQTGELLAAFLHGPKVTKNKARRQESHRMDELGRSIPATQNSTPSTKQGQKSQVTPMVTDSRGRKRKAPEPRAPPPASKRKTNGRAARREHSPQAARLAIEQNLNVPRELLAKPKESLNNILQGYAKLTTVFSQSKNSPFRCTLVCSFPGGEQIATTKGQDRKRKQAEIAAYLQLAAECSHNEHLKPRLALLKIDKLNQNVLREEKDAKSDIYNYAARFDAIPEITEQMIRLRSKKIYEVTVKLPEQNIQVAGRGTRIRAAEIAAALNFKEAAEKYQAEHGDKSLIIKDSAALTTETGGKFFDFYKIKYPNAVVEVRHDKGAGATDVAVKKLIGQGVNSAHVNLNGKLIGQVVSMSSKQKAEELAFLTAAIEVKKAEPELFPGFVRAMAVGNGEILKPVPPVDLIMDEDSQLTMREMLLAARKSGLSDQIEQFVSDEQKASKPRENRRQLSPSKSQRRSEDLMQRLGKFAQNPRLAELRQKKEELPMNQHRAQVLDLVSNNSYSIIVGATGSGKTTQVPQIILEDAISRGVGASCNIICTQPRRIAAISIARRVAAERAEQLQDTVGYSVRFDTKSPSYGGSVTYSTTGMLMRLLQNDSDNVMQGISHIVVDEVHERDTFIDFLLILLKKIMSQRAAAGKSTPKVILMSATMNTDLFASYFGTQVEGKGTVGCPSLSVPGRTFPVTEKYLEEITSELRQSFPREASSLLQKDPPTADFLKAEHQFQKQYIRVPKSSIEGSAKPGEFAIDWKSERKIDTDGRVVYSTDTEDSIVPFGLIAMTIAHISRTTNEGAILVFLPGLEEMTKVEELLYTVPLGMDFKDDSKYKLFLLHSSIPTAQTDVFNDVPAGCRKIILSTNIAETSVTIPDVQYVVDTGKCREKQYDQSRRISQLKSTWISKSNAKQRAGRAGRVQNGNYYALYSAERYDSFRAAGLPEILRTDLQELCLDIKTQAFAYPIRNFLADALEPPSPQTVDTSVKNLQALNALTAEEEITPLGRLLAALPVHPSLGKMIILGVIFRCLDPMLVIGGAAGERGLFVSPLADKQAAQAAKVSFTYNSQSDHLSTLNAIREMRRVRDTRGEYEMRRYAHENFIHIAAFKTIENSAKQIEEILVDAGLVPYTPEHRRHNGEYGDPSLNENSGKVPLIKALTIAGLHPNLSVAGGSVLHRTPREARTIIHPSSINSQLGHGRTPAFGSLHAYSAMARANDGRSVFLRDTTKCTPLQVALFGGKLARRNNILEMDDWLPFFVKSDSRHMQFSQTSKTLLEFREALDRLLARAFMDLKGRKEDAAANGGAKGEYLADNRARAVFAEGLVEILDRDGARALEQRGDMRSRDAFDEAKGRARKRRSGSAVGEDAGRGVEFLKKRGAVG